MNRLYRLLAFGYFPKEMPPLFSTNSFARHAFSFPPQDIEHLIGRQWQRPSPFLLQQKSHYRRRLDILCPQSFFGQAHVIATNYPQIRNFFSNHQGYCSKLAFNRKTKFQRAVRPFAIGRAYTFAKLDLRSRFPLVLKLDIKNYYRSVYTHSIPWAVHGKAYAKSHQRDDNLGNNLDRIVRQGQDGQTIGIPTGPDTSFIIAELILSRIIDELIEDAKIEQDRCVRFYDDIEYGCENEEEAHRLLATFENALRKYELEINPDKVQILSGPVAVESPWVYRLRDIPWQESIREDKLLEMFAFLAEISQQNPNGHVFRYFLRKMRTSVIDESAWKTYQRILLSLLQENRGNAKEVFEQLHCYREIGWTLDRSALKQALDRKVRHEIARGVTSELCWAIYGYFLFNIKLEKETAAAALRDGDTSSQVLIAKLIQDRRLALRSEINGLVRSWGEDVLNSPDWLLAYEILVNHWHNRYTAVPFPDNSGLFERLYDSGVSFLRETTTPITELPHAFRRHLPQENQMGEADEHGAVGLSPDFLSNDEVEGDSPEEDDDDVATAFSVY